MKNKIIKNIKRELKERKSNINKLCRTLHVNRNYISQLKDNTPVSKLKKISDAIGCNLASLFVGVQSHKLFLLIPLFFRNIFEGSAKERFRFHIENATISNCHFIALVLPKIDFENGNRFDEMKGGG